MHPAQKQLTFFPQTWVPRMAQRQGKKEVLDLVLSMSKSGAFARPQSSSKVNWNTIQSTASPTVSRPILLPEVRKGWTLGSQRSFRLIWPISLMGHKDPIAQGWRYVRSRGGRVEQKLERGQHRNQVQHRTAEGQQASDLGQEKQLQPTRLYGSPAPKFPETRGKDLITLDMPQRNFKLKQKLRHFIEAVYHLSQIWFQFRSAE